MGQGSPVPADDRHGPLRGSGMVVLVIEDRDVRNRYAKALRDVGFMVTPASEGQEGLSLLFSNRPRVLVLDVILPDVDGIEVCRKAREIHGDRIAIIFLSSIEDLELVELCLESGGNDYMIQTDDIDAIAERVCYWAKARPIYRRQKHRARTLAAIRAAVHGREQADMAPGGVLSSENDQDVAQMTEMIARARAIAGEEFGRTVDEKLCLIGYVAGVVDYWSSLRSHVKTRRTDYLQAVLRETEILSHREIRLLISSWREVVEDPAFADALKRGTRDTIACQTKGSTYVPTGLTKIEIESPQRRPVSGFRDRIAGNQ